MALRGDVSPADYTEDTIAAPDVLAFIPRIKIFVDPRIESMGAAFRHAARVVVRTTDGKTFEREILNRRGSPENAVSRADVERKFTSNVADLLEPNSIDQLKQLAERLERLADASELNAIMAAPFKDAEAGRRFGGCRRAGRLTSVACRDGR